MEASIKARLPGINSAPPIPCTSRARIKTLPLGARPQPSDATVNITNPTRNTRRRP
jgi:hypothetical protein